jgi:hypothetical protein
MIKLKSVVLPAAPCNLNAHQRPGPWNLPRSRMEVLTLKWWIRRRIIMCRCWSRLGFRLCDWLQALTLALKLCLKWPFIDGSVCPRICSTCWLYFCMFIYDGRANKKTNVDQTNESEPLRSQHVSIHDKSPKEDNLRRGWMRSFQTFLREQQLVIAFESVGSKTMNRKMKSTLQSELN